MPTQLSPTQVRALDDVQAARQARIAATEQYRQELIEGRRMGLSLAALGQAAGTSHEAVRTMIERNSFTRKRERTQ